MAECCLRLSSVLSAKIQAVDLWASSKVSTAEAQKGWCSLELQKEGGFLPKHRPRQLNIISIEEITHFSWFGERGKKELVSA